MSRGARTRSIRGAPRRAALATMMTAALVSAGASFAATPGASSAAVPGLDTVVLRNGLTIDRLERTSLPLVELLLLIPSGGAADPPGKEGLASLTAALLSRGSAGKSAAQFAEEVEFLGGVLQADADADRTLIAGEFAARDFETGLTLLAGMVRRPAFSGEEVERERDLLVAARDAALDAPEALAEEALARVLFACHPYARPVEGFRSTLRTLTRDDVTGWHARHFAAGKALLAVVGPIDAARARRAIDRAFGDWARGAPAEERLPPLPRVAGRDILLIDRPDATQSQIRVAQATLPRTDPAWPALAVGNAVLGGGFSSRLNDEIRVKRGLAYGIDSYLVPRRAGATFVVATATRNEKAIESLGLVLDLVGRMQKQGLSEEELAAGQSYLAGLAPLRIESPDALAAALVQRRLLGLDPTGFVRYPQELRAVRLDDANAAVRRGLPGEDRAIVVVGPAAALQEPLGRYGKVTVRPASWVVDGGR
jgi:zinc protease